MTTLDGIQARRRCRVSVAWGSIAHDRTIRA